MVSVNGSEGNESFRRLYIHKVSVCGNGWNKDVPRRAFYGVRICTPALSLAELLDLLDMRLIKL